MIYEPKPPQSAVNAWGVSIDWNIGQQTVARQTVYYRALDGSISTVTLYDTGLPIEETTFEHFRTFEQMVEAFIPPPEKTELRPVRLHPVIVKQLLAWEPDAALVAPRPVCNRYLHLERDRTRKGNPTYQERKAQHEHVRDKRLEWVSPPLVRTPQEAA